MTSKALDKNLQLWSHFYPKEAIMLPYLDSQDYVIDKGVLYGPKGSYAVKEPEKWFKALKFNDEKVLVVYGVGLGELFEPIEKWLKEDKTRKVFFFEEDPSVLLRLFSLP